MADGISCAAVYEAALYEPESPYALAPYALPGTTGTTGTTGAIGTTEESSYGAAEDTALSTGVTVDGHGVG